jgi:hypothetical protein
VTHSIGFLAAYEILMEGSEVPECVLGMMVALLVASRNLRE